MVGPRALSSRAGGKGPQPEFTLVCSMDCASWTLLVSTGPSGLRKCVGHCQVKQCTLDPKRYLYSSGNDSTIENGFKFRI